MRVDLSGIFEVQKDIEVLGGVFKVGMLVDRSLFGGGILQRCVTSRAIRQVEGVGVGA
jgi:hypothetical protein